MDAQNTRRFSLFGEVAVAASLKAVSSVRHSFSY